MTIKFYWSCPYCNRTATITDSNYSSSIHYFDNDNKDGALGLSTKIISCPNEKCREYVITGYLYKAQFNTRYTIQDNNPILTWKMKPSSSSKQFPKYIPQPIILDYEEACLIKDLSPKASATLSRRCLQGIIRDFWSISKGRLVDEINEIKNQIDPTTWNAIDAVRNIGNIGAHMEKDINLIIDVDPNEAQLLIGLIEMLIKDWYITKYERQQNLENIIKVANKKKEEKKNNKKNNSA